MGKKHVVKVLILVFLGIFVILNVLGLVVELLIQTNVINVEFVNIRGIMSLSSILSLALVASAIIFWIKFFKNGKRLVMWWNIFIFTAMLVVLFKLIWPTIFVELVPFYFLIFPLGIIFIWLGVFKYLKKGNIFGQYKWGPILK